MDPAVVAPPIAAADELRRLQSVIPLLGSTQPLEDILLHFIRAAMQASGASAGSVWLYEPGAPHLDYAASIGLPDAYVRAFAKCPVGAGTCGRVVATCAPVLSEDTQTDPAFEYVRDVSLAAGVRGVFSVPILGSDGRPLGSLANHFPVPHLPPAEDVERNLAYAALAGAVIERRRFERQLITLTREQERSRHREEALEVVAHDLRSPVTAILANTSLLKRTLAMTSGTREQQQLERVENAARRLDTLVNDLLDLSAMEGGRFTVRCREHEVRELVREAVDPFRLAAAQKSISLVDQVERDVLLRCDRDRIDQVLSNLIANAIKFTPQGGRVTVSANVEADGVRLSVSDTGIGMSDEETRHLFDRFWRAKNAPEKGFGLGLSIVKGIVLAHGGEITVETAPDAGSTFAIHLPNAPCSQSQNGRRATG